MDTLLDEGKLLLARIERDREQLERIRSIALGLEAHLQRDERLLEEINSALGRSAQLKLDDADIRLRGRRLEGIAVQVLERKLGADAEVHYRDWFELLRDEGHLVAGKDPVNTFLSQINRSDAVEKVGRRSGRYRLNRAA